MNMFICYCFIFLKSFIGLGDSTEAPSKYFDLKDWKLQIPGPLDVKDLKDYSNSHFYLTSDTALCFNLDAAEQGHTTNTHYVRSELRHVPNWDTKTKHEITARVKVTTNLPNYEVTVVQIHGITNDNENAPPLLRVAMVNGDVYAFLKSDALGKKTEKIMLTNAIDSKYFDVSVKTENWNLIISINGRECLRRTLYYWNYKNYFKLGCYPQVVEGLFKIYFKDFSVY